MISLSQAETLIKNGADVCVSHHCDVYNEWLEFRSACICNGEVNLFAKYMSENPQINNTALNYIIYHNHTLTNSLCLLRTKHQAGDGAYGGLFGLPSCTIIKNFQNQNQRWSFDDCWELCDMDTRDIFGNCATIKVRLTTPRYTAICKPCVIMQQDNGELSIRTYPISIRTDNGMGVIRHYISENRVYERTWHILEDPTRFSPMWFTQTLRQVSGNGCWHVSCNVIKDFTLEYLRKKSNSELHVGSLL